MKKIVITLGLCFTFLVAFTQNSAKIDTELQQEMLLRETDDMIRVNIILNQQYDQMEMRMKSSIFPKKEIRRTFVVNELKRFSEETQLGVMNLLSTMPAVSEVQSFWIANFINCYATNEAIEELSLHPDVLIIGFDKEQYMLPEGETPRPADYTRELTYNVTKVLADQVWALGYEGENVVVAIIDTGVNYNHNDLKTHMWEHPDFPNHGWNVYANNNNPMDDHAHGTHCAGTVAGDGTSGSQTGMAPKALIMALKVWSSGGSGSTSQMCGGFQFAVEHGAHVASMSGGVYQGGTESERIQFRNTMINVLEAGVIASIAAGNEGPDGYNPVSAPNSVRVPGNCPPPWLHPDQTTTGGTSAVVSVGATDSNDNIAEFSSRGPVTWQSISGFNDYPYNPGMGLLRPDVCAPGVDIKSCTHNNNSGYTLMDGTSMACPCVSGVMALMLSKNPELTPAEICEILETTAVKLPTPASSKNNTYGSGRINALDAVEAIEVGPISIHEVVIDDSEGDDNGNANPAETIKFDFSLINTSELNVNNVTVTLISSNEYVVIIEDYADFGNFAAGEVKQIEGAFTFALSSLVPAKKKLDFTAVISTNDDDFTNKFNILAFDYELNLTKTAVDDAAGNGNNILDPGETADILTTIANIGNEPVKGLTGFLTSNSSDITINSSMADFNDMEPDENNSTPYNVTLSTSAVPGSVNIPFNLLLTDEDGRQSTLNFVYRDKCTVVFDLHDSDGDGWNGNILVVNFSDGSPTQNLTINNGTFATYSFAINSGVTVSLSWISGYWTSECSFEVYYQDGDPIYATSGNPGSGVFFSWIVNCGGSSVNCDPISDLSTTVNGNTVELTWTAPVSGTPTHYEIYNNFESLGSTTELHFSAPLNDGDNQFCVYAVFENCLMPQCIFVRVDCPPPSDIIYNIGYAGIVDISWNKPVDDVNLIGYNIYIDEMLVAKTVSEESFTFNGEEKDYNFCVSAFHTVDGIGCESELVCETISVTINCDLIAELVLEPDGQILHLSWLPALENVSYNIYRNSEFLINVEENSYVDTDIELYKSYCYTVTVVCIDDLESEPSNEECHVPIGIDEMENQVKIYPNPTGGELKIESEELRMKQIQVFDVTGRCLQEVTPADNTEIIIDISRFSVGIYFLQIQTETGTIMKKVVKN